MLAEAPRVAPRDAEVMYEMARLQMVQNRPMAAVSYLRSCVSENPQFPDGWFTLGLAYEAGGVMAEAAATFSSQLELTPGHADAWQHLARARYGLRSGAADSSGGR